MTETKPMPLGSLLASAKKITSKKLGGAVAKKRTNDLEWQEEAWDMYDLVGEQRFLTDTLAERMSKARLYIGEIDPSNVTNTPDEVEDPAIVDVLNAFGRNQSGREQLLKRLGVNLYIAGDAWLVGVPKELMKIVEDTDDRRDSTIGEVVKLPEPIGLTSDLNYEWFLLSTSEVSVERRGVKLDLPGLTNDVVLVPEDIHLIRVWDSHPRWWDRATSVTKACLPVLKELVGLTMHVSAQVQSRLAGAGILVVPASAQASFQVAAGTDADSSTDEFTEALLESMLTPISDRSNASAVVPLIITVPDEAADLIKHITFSSSLDAEARELRDEAIRRLALSQNAPPEILLGTAGMNHWGGWLVKEDVITTHLEPTLSLICDSLTTQYLWPTLEAQGVEDFEKYVIWYDVNHLVVRPNQSADAMNLHEKGTISDKQLLALMGVDDDPETKPLDLVQTVAMQFLRQHPDLLMNPGPEAVFKAVESFYSKNWDALKEHLPDPEEQPDPFEDGDAAPPVTEEIEPTGEDMPDPIPQTDQNPPPPELP